MDIDNRAEPKKETISIWYREKWFSFLILGLVALAAVLVNIVWVVQDQSPPLWDIAGHSQRSLQISELMANFKPRTILNLDTIYPPFSYIVTGTFFLIGGRHFDIPQISLLFWLLIYILSVYGIAHYLLKNRWLAILALAISLFYPLLAHFSRIYDLDFPLTAMTMASLAALIKSNGFKSRKWSILFGLATALAILTKWTAVVFILGPLIYILIKSFKDKESRKTKKINLVILIAIILTLIAPWYLTHAKDIWKSAQATRQNIFSVPTEDLFSLDNIGYYVRKTVNSLTWPLAAWSLVGLFFFIKNRVKNGWFLLAWIVVPYLIMTFLFYSKESRYFLPVFPALAILAATSFWKVNRIWRHVGIGLILTMGVFVWTETSWGVKSFSDNIYEKLALSEEYGYKNVTYSDVRYGFTYPTQYHNNLEVVASALKTDLQQNKSEHNLIKIAVVPNSIFLSGQPVQYWGRLLELESFNHDYQVDYALSSRIRSTDWQEVITEADYLITKTGDQGPAIWGKHLAEIAESEKNGDPIFDNFELIQSWPLLGIEEDNQAVNLYRLIE
ncbi:MAG: phospholipid carrier-dependent glycosyltransferase [Patescibacteria group bacterium]